MLSIASILDEPNTEDPLRPELAELYNTSKDEYKAKAKACTKMYAMDLE